MTDEERMALNIEPLPRNLYEALNGLEQDELVKQVLGEELCKCYIAAKKQEWESYSAQVSQWETEQYLYRF